MHEAELAQRCLSHGSNNHDVSNNCSVDKVIIQKRKTAGYHSEAEGRFLLLRSGGPFFFNQMFQTVVVVLAFFAKPH